MTLKGLASFTLLVVALHGCAVPGDEAPIYGVSDLTNERTAGPDSVIIKWRGLDEASVLVTIDTNGRVTSARVLDAHPTTAPAVLAAARKWRFRPQRFDGRPIRAIGRIVIKLRHPEIPADQSIPFPMGDLQNAEITLHRSACFGTCPDYTVSIRGDGRVRYSSEQWTPPGTVAAVHRQFSGGNVVWAGTHEARVDQTKVAALIGRFREANFMGLQNEYRAGITDNPTYVLQLTIGGITKRVVDYAGPRVGMPASVTRLEKAVDELAQSARWTRGNAGTVALLKEQGFDFRSSKTVDLVAAAIRLNYGDEKANVSELIRALMEENIDLSSTGGDNIRLGTLITQHAVRAGDLELLDMMRDAGELSKVDRKWLNDALLNGEGCRAEIAHALVEAGADPAARQEGGNALNAMGDTWGPCYGADAARRLEFGRALIALGVPLEARSTIDWTPLMGIDDPALAQLLIEAGADVNARSEDGDAPLSATMDDRVAILLLRADADPEGEFDGQSLREIAARRPWPATTAWLNKHGVD